MSKFNSGDLVQLKSGGPKMTVQRYIPSFRNTILANWFDSNNTLQNGNFHEDTLTLFDQNDNNTLEKKE
ncbi:YodC family protein [Flavobacterium hydatis]|uniref:DUF2158 domain-containing protein n=1 Tax=Flavobacterium hydatis TaxID=991 RepID=A0ABX4BZJ8_FLAHY|nr:DUF2158 domain-containing protein [Flavobacterium hydatis]OXA85032.1 hypothetical protein B0A62_24695 [Flavobacterium hydatis]